MGNAPHDNHEAAETVVDRVWEIRGTVQGVGFRPFVVRLAGRLGIRGWVRNDLRGVTIRALASPGVLREFADALAREAPAAARLASLREGAASERRGLAPLPAQGFVILVSELEAVARTVAVPPDLALCADCRRELATPGDRRWRYPFVNCTQCGPRYTIICDLPYDRPRTTMAAFRMCPSCQREYDLPSDRRYHAQPNACPACGPQVELHDTAGRGQAGAASAMAEAGAALRAGRIVAVKGMGGFHLMVDAANETAVAELRRRKHREEKPLAVMFPSLEALRACADPTVDEERWLASAAAPIVLVRRRIGAPLASSVAPGNPWVGALLPHAPLQVLLLEEVGRPVVATSGNLSEEPLCADNDEARSRLGGIADLFLVHNRPIARPIDDSVMRPSGEGMILLRRARGFAPAPLALPPGVAATEPLLCVGGHMKSTVAVAAGTGLVLSPHLGDLENPISVAAFRRAVELLGSLHAARFAAVVCDAHPDYASTRYAESLGLPILRVQHHLAHILACLLEHEGGPDRVLGVAWDGTGYGPDGSVWGGEFLAVDRVARTARRVAHLRPFRLPGGEAAVREPRRSALGLLRELGAGEEAGFAPLAAALGFRAAELALLNTILDRGLRAPITTSAGRLFDGVAALLGVRRISSFEGQAAMELEFAAEGAAGDAEPWPFPAVESAGRCCLELDWRPMLQRLLELRGTVAPAGLAAQFHATLARGIADVARRVGLPAVALSGGCFQNARLLELTTRELRRAGFQVLAHRELPPNDGGISAGQALGALWGMTTVSLGP
ncbi:MAG: carbamoyltransferase HypF [Verrucomicrobia bacterium]|nr:carbamoyltransferase HypF [Verrucomicrobiota bacterium]